MPTYRNYPQQTAIGRRFLSMFYGINLYGYFLKWELAIMVKAVTSFNPVRVRDAGKAGFIKPVRFDVRMPSEPLFQTALLLLMRLYSQFRLRVFSANESMAIWHSCLR